MPKFQIYGPNKLAGEIEVNGSKNAAMKMIAASVLIPGKITLENVPDILDIQTIVDILTENGAEIIREGHALSIDTTNLNTNDPDPRLVEKMRGSIVLIGPYLARFGKISIPQPGGCAIGARPIDIHLDIFSQFGVEIECLNNTYHFKTTGFKEKNIVLKGQSVTATENAIMAGVLAKGQITIENAAREPEIKDLAEFLNLAGAQITGAGTSEIKIIGVQNLKPVTYEVCPDRIETGTFAALAIATKSPLKINKCRPEDLTAFLDKITAMGVKFEKGKDFLYIKEPGDLQAIDVETAVHPGFPTDLQAPMGLMMTQAEGKSHIKENIFEHRLGYLKELKQMGANVKIINSRKAEIIGPTELKGKTVESLDLRAGVTLLIAGLIASDKTTILDAQIIDRGYENIEKRLQKIGAKITRI